MIMKVYRKYFQNKLVMIWISLKNIAPLPTKKNWNQFKYVEILFVAELEICWQSPNFFNGSTKYLFVTMKCISLPWSIFG